MTQEITLDRKTEDAVNFARILYAAHGLTFFFSLGLLSILPLIFNYVKRPETEGTVAYSHHSWMIRSFWWYAVWMLVAWIFAATFVGLVIAVPMWAVVWLWKAYRLIRGFIDLNNNRAMPV
jgi:uncharacterized membrane protein